MQVDPRHSRMLFRRAGQRKKERVQRSFLQVLHVAVISAIIITSYNICEIKLSMSVDP